MRLDLSLSPGIREAFETAPRNIPDDATQTSVSTALPTIVHDLEGEDFVWVASSYALASVALLPASGGFAEVRTTNRHRYSSDKVDLLFQLFGRRATMLGSQALFALGSALCGCAQNMNWLIAARSEC